MKTVNFLFIICLCLFISTQSKAQTTMELWNSIEEVSYSCPEEIVDIVTHNISSPEFVYDKTFSLPDSYHFIDCNIPFARQFSISGGHLSFIVDKEDFDFYFYRGHEQDGYFDLQVGFYVKLGPVLAQQLYKIGIIRIIFSN